MSTKQIDHSIKKELQNYREKLSKLWRDDQIYDLTPTAATLVLIYSTLEHRHKKEPIPPGRSIFFWDRLDKSILHFHKLSTNIIDHTLEISPKGLLHFEGEIFKTPNEFLGALTLKTHIVHQRIKIEPETPLKAILEKKSDFQSS